MRKFIFTIIALIFSVSLNYSQVTTLWERSTAAGNKPVWDTGSATRGISYGKVNSQDLLFIVNTTFTKQIFVYNSATGDSIAKLDTTGLSGGTRVVNDVEVSSDGKIFVCNLAVGGFFKVYRYDSLSAAPIEVINYDATDRRLGDKFTIIGSTTDNSIVIWAVSADTDGEILKFTTADNGYSFSPTILDVGSFTSFGSAAVGPLANEDFYFNAQGSNAQKYSSSGSLIGTIPSSILTTGGSSIRYLTTFLGDEYIVANELSASTNNAKVIKVKNGDPTIASVLGSTPLLGTNSAGGLGDVSVQKISDYVYNIFVLATNNGFGAYQVDLRVPLVGNYFIPQGANPQGFPTLADAVASLNINGANGTVNFLLDADTLRENSFTFSADLSEDNNVVVKPAPGRDVVLFVTAGASKGNGIQMIGFDRGFVTFDGSNNGTNSRNLIISTEQDAVAVPFGLNTANADNVVLKNLMIKNIVDVPLNFRYGAVINDVGGVMGFHVENCQIGTPEKPVRRDGLAPWGGGATPNSFTFLNNEINAGVRGITTIYLIDSEIRGNTINLIPTGLTGGTDAYNHGIYITGAQGVLNINENTINCLTKTTVATSYLIGIAFAGNSEGGTDWINVFNNMINVGAADETRPTYGIGLRSANPMGNLKIYHNTILINDNASTLVSYGIGNHTNGTGPVNIDLKNNVIINNHNGNAGSSAIGLIPVTSVLVSDYNDLYSTQNLVNYQGTLYADLAAWQTTNQDLNSVSKLANFVSATDLHLTGASLGDPDLTGTPLAEVTTDIDGDTRSTTYPYKGADEGSVSLEPKVPDLFISEYLEGSSNNKAIELFNPTGSDIDLSKYRLVRANNGSPTIQYTQLLAGTLLSGDVYVLANPSAVTEILSVADVDTGEITFFNGDDYIGLEKDIAGNWTVIDVIGILGNDPGTNWPVAGGLGATSEFTLVRKNTVFYGNTDWNSSAGTDASNSEWIVYPQNTFTYLGAHSVIPVELTSFVASVGAKSVTLSWSTATETNNKGFEVERKSANTEWAKVGFVNGFGTTTEKKEYTFTDKNLPVGKYSYRLKQVDFDGTFEYSKVVEVEVLAPKVFELAQNYPNPFNPTTKINYSVPFDSKVTISVYSITGELVMELVNDFVAAGSYSVDFNGSNLASGMYIYRMVAGNFVQTQKMMLMK